VLETPEREYAPEFAAPRRTSVAPKRKLRRDFTDDFADDFSDDDDAPVGRRRSATRVRVRGGLPRTIGGRIAAVVAVLAVVGVCVGTVLMVRDMLMHDDRFIVPSSSAIEIEGNSHLTKAQLLSIFGGDVERNIFTISLAERKAQLERLPWVEHATVMRLLPDRMRVSITERTPVAFVRQGNHIGLVDGNGVLLDMPTDVSANTHYSFPVVTGISASDPLSVRAARMKIYAKFTGDLDADGERVSQSLSEVDLSNPEDVKAVVPDHSSEVLVHFGEDNFLERYQKYEAHLAEWRAQYPRLSSVDMRYDRQAVLEMQPGSSVPVAPAASGLSEAGAAVTTPAAAPAKAPVAAAVHPAAAKSTAKAKGPVHPVHHASAHPTAAKKAPAARSVATWVHPKSTAATKHAAVPSDVSRQQYHPPQVVQP
jgi:cell division protein FtsQ